MGNPGNDIIVPCVLLLSLFEISRRVNGRDFD